MKQKKTYKVIGIVLAALLVLATGLTVVSHAVYHRSDMATLVELYFRISGTKKKFADPEACADYIERRRDAEDYELTVKLKSDVSERRVNGNRVYTLSRSDAPDYRILYLHGGAYINDASAYHWKLCDRLVQERNAQVIFPIYPLTPEHTWEETYALVTALYEEMIDGADSPVVIMGDSAGGGLAVAFCEYLAELGLPQPDELILFSPWMDISLSNPAAADYEKADPMLSAYGLVEMGKCWAGDLLRAASSAATAMGSVRRTRSVWRAIPVRRSLSFP